MNTLSNAGEDSIIQTLTARWPRCSGRMLHGVGDDCAVLSGGSTKSVLLFKTDAIAEGSHFLPTHPGLKIGWKAAARCVSDIAAMGGKPLSAVVTLATPQTTSVRRLDSIYRGLEACAKAYGFTLSGGETIASQQLILSIAMLGEAPQNRVLLRSGGAPGDHLWVTGKLGGSLRGKHLTFRPRLDEALWLAHGQLATAMMDLSDGLASDLPRLAKASRCSFDLFLETIPITRGCSLEHALGDGEDFELLFACSPKASSRLAAAWPFRTELTRVGVLTSPRKAPTLLPTCGFDHFKKR